MMTIGLLVAFMVVLYTYQTMLRKDPDELDRRGNSLHRRRKKY